MENPNNSDINDIDLLFSQKGKIKSRGRLILTQDQRHHVVLSLSYMVAMWVQQLQPPHLCSRKEHGREKKHKWEKNFLPLRSISGNPTQKTFIYFS